MSRGEARASAAAVLARTVQNLGQWSGQPAGLLAAARYLREQAGTLEALAVEAARDESLSWRVIGAQLGVTAQAARQKWQRRQKTATTDPFDGYLARRKRAHDEARRTGRRAA